jgi:hypothetical protein
VHLICYTLCLTLRVERILYRRAITKDDVFFIYKVEEDLNAKVCFRLGKRIWETS